MQPANDCCEDVCSIDRCREGEEGCDNVRGNNGGGEGMAGGWVQKLEVVYWMDGGPRCTSAVVCRADAWGDSGALGDGNDDEIIGTPVASRTADSSHSEVTLVMV